MQAAAGFIKSLLGGVIALVFIVFTVMNQQPVALLWMPMMDPLTLPLYAPILGGALFGFFWGALAVFFSHSRIRRERRAQAKELRRLEKERQELMKTQIPGYSHDLHQPPNLSRLP